MGHNTGLNYGNIDLLSSYEVPVDSAGSDPRLQPQERTSEVFTPDEHRRRLSSPAAAGHASMASLPRQAKSNLSLAEEGIDIESCNAAVATAVEDTMKKYADNLEQMLGTFNGRVSRLESRVFTLNHSIKDVKTSAAKNHHKSSASLQYISNHVTEAQRIVQLMRDKQEIFETQVELMKVQLSKDASSIVEDQRSLMNAAEVSRSFPEQQHLQTEALTNVVAPQAQSATPMSSLCLPSGIEYISHAHMQQVEPSQRVSFLVGFPSPMWMQTQQLAMPPQLLAQHIVPAVPQSQQSQLLHQELMAHQPAHRSMNTQPNVMMFQSAQPQVQHYQS